MIRMNGHCTTPGRFPWRVTTQRSTAWRIESNSSSAILRFAPRLERMFVFSRTWAARERWGGARIRRTRPSNHHLAGGADGGAEERERVAFPYLINGQSLLRHQTFDWAHSVAPTIGYYLPRAPTTKTSRPARSSVRQCISVVCSLDDRAAGSSGNETGGGDAQKLSKKARRRARKRTQLAARRPRKLFLADRDPALLLLCRLGLFEHERRDALHGCTELGDEQVSPDELESKSRSNISKTEL